MLYLVLNKTDGALLMCNSPLAEDTTDLQESSCKIVKSSLLETNKNGEKE